MILKKAIRRKRWGLSELVFFRVVARPTEVDRAVIPSRSSGHQEVDWEVLVVSEALVGWEVSVVTGVWVVIGASEFIAE